MENPLKKIAKTWIGKQVNCPDGSKGELISLIGFFEGRVRYGDGSVRRFPLKQLYLSEEK